MLRALPNKTGGRINLLDRALNFIISYQKLKMAIPRLPYTLDLKNQKVNFVYIGIKHSNNPKSIQFNKIKSLFRKFLKSNRNKKLAVGVENNFPNGNFSKNQLIKKYGESGLLVYLAKKNNLEIICPEPSQDDMLNLILAEDKFDKLEILSWIYLNMLYSVLKREKSLPDTITKIRPSFDQIIKKREFKKTNENLITKIHERIKKVSGKTITDMSAQELCKLQDPFESGTLLNNIGAEFNIIRDKLIAWNFLNVLSEGKSIFSVYGLNHVLAQEPVFKEFFKIKRPS